MTELLQHARPTVPALTPMLLSFVAGYVDSYTYLTLFGLFVAQVTGSFVIAGAELVRFQHIHNTAIFPEPLDHFGDRS